jgi:ubiquinone/menaquinone biosynthesis C-methylase UbiE
MNGAVFLFSRKTGVKRGDRVLEVGSLDVNGSVRENFLVAAEYVGIDIRPGKCVDVVMAAEELPEKYPAGHFDCIVSCETLEHCEHWKECLRAIWHVLKTGGRLCITTPTKEKGRHNHPLDYWRWTLDDYVAIFKDQSILKAEDVPPRSVGVIVEKLTDSLFLDLEPYEVP